MTDSSPERPVAGKPTVQLRRRAVCCLAALLVIGTALQSKHISPATRKSALYNLASSHFDEGRYDLAFPHLEELAKSERSEISLMLLGICHQKKGNLPEAVRWIHEAILASPDRADLHSYLASIYREMGKSKDAEHHLHRAKLLRLKVPQPG